MGCTAIATEYVDATLRSTFAILRDTPGTEGEGEDVREGGIMDEDGVGELDAEVDLVAEGEGVIEGVGVADGYTHAGPY